MSTFTILVFLAGGCGLLLGLSALFFVVIGRTKTAAALLGIAVLALALSGGLVASKLYRDGTKFLSEMSHLTRYTYEILAEDSSRSLLSQAKYQDPKRLNRFEAKVYSQAGEDGILAEIFRRIGTTNRIFCEFGASDGQENNTVLLLRLGWSGLWIEGDPDRVAAARRRCRDEIASGKLTILNAFITAENIEGLFRQGRLPAEMDLMSIDIDRNDYYVWKSIVHYRPRVVVIEYNSIFPPGIDWVVNYDPKAIWDGTSRAGGSLTAFERLGRQKGYSLVGCNLGGVNAFFVRDDLLGGRFAAPFTSENHYEPPRYPLQFRIPGHPRNP